MSERDADIKKKLPDSSHPSDEQLFDHIHGEPGTTNDEVSIHVNACSECNAKVIAARQGLASVVEYAGAPPAVPEAGQQRIDAAVGAEWARRERVRSANKGMPTWRKRLNVAALFCVLAVVMGIAVVGPGGKSAVQHAEPSAERDKSPATVTTGDLAEPDTNGLNAEQTKQRQAKPAASDSVMKDSDEQSAVAGTAAVADDAGTSGGPQSAGNPVAEDAGSNTFSKGDEMASEPVPPPTCHWIDFDNLSEPVGADITSTVPLPPTIYPDSNLDFWPLSGGFAVQCIGSAGSGAEGVGGKP